MGNLRIERQEVLVGRLVFTREKVDSVNLRISFTRTTINAEGMAVVVWHLGAERRGLRLTAKASIGRSTSICRCTIAIGACRSIAHLSGNTSCSVKAMFFSTSISLNLTLKSKEAFRACAISVVVVSLPEFFVGLIGRIVL